MSNDNFYDFENVNETSGEENSPEVEETKTTEEVQEETKIKQTFVTYIPYGFTPKTYEEYRSIKKAAKTIGAAFLIMTAVILILNIFATLSVQISGFMAEDVFSLLEEPAIMHAQQIIFSIIAFVVTFSAVFKIAGYRISSLIEFGKPKKATILPFFLFGVGFCAFANIATSYAGQFFESFGIEYNVNFGENPKGFFGFLLTVISTVIVPSLVEEFACRGLILGSLRKFGDSFAVIVSAILFGLLHGNFQQMPFAFLVGLILGFVTVQSGSIWIAVWVHAFNNMISVVFDYFLGNLSVGTQNIIYMIFLCVSMLLGIIALLLFRNKNQSVYRFAKAEEMECLEGKKYKWFFCSATVIIFIVISLLESLAFFII